MPISTTRRLTKSTNPKRESNKCATAFLVKLLHKGIQISSMKKYFVCLLFLVGFVYLQSCSRKTTPSKTADESTTVVTPEVVTPAVPKRPVRVKTPIPKSIVVSDKAATKTVQGRYYYDLEGKRYWRNNKDGKYYLYYSGMFDNKDFQ